MRAPADRASSRPRARTPARRVMEAEAFSSANKPGTAAVPAGAGMALAAPFGRQMCHMCEQREGRHRVGSDGDRSTDPEDPLLCMQCIPSHARCWRCKQPGGGDDQVREICLAVEFFVDRVAVAAELGHHHAGQRRNHD